MALKDKRKELLEYVESYRTYLSYNTALSEILEGDVKSHLIKKMTSFLGEDYFSKIINRLVPINVLKRMIDKESKCYTHRPVRTTVDKYKNLLSYYEKKFDMNSNMSQADEFSNLYKGYSAEPFIDRYGMPKLRVIPYDSFLPYSDDPIDPTCMTVMIKIIGFKDIRTAQGSVEKRMVFYAYSDTEFDAFDSKLDTYEPAMKDNPNGVNPIGVIPQTYGNRSRQKLVPRQDSDIYDLSLFFPVIFSDLSGVSMFQCFSILYGIDIDLKDLRISPNAFWDLKSDPVSKVKPEVGVIKPEANLKDVLDFGMETFAFWMETRGNKVGSVGNADGRSNASGIAKIIDEMDSFEIRKRSIEWFKKEETIFWDKMVKHHNYWVSLPEVDPELKRFGMITDEFKVSITFDEPQPQVDRKTFVETVALEVEKKFLDHESAIETLYPDLTPTEIKERMDKIEDEFEMGFFESVDNKADGADTEVDSEEEYSSENAPAMPETKNGGGAGVYKGKLKKK